MSVTLVQSLMAEFGTCFHRKYTDISDHNRILNGGRGGGVIQNDFDQLRAKHIDNVMKKISHKLVFVTIM